VKEQNRQEGSQLRPPDLWAISRSFRSRWRGDSAMSFDLLKRLSETLGSWHIPTLTTVSVVALCAALGATIGVVFPMRSLVSLQPRTLSIEDHGNVKELTQASVDTAKTSPEHESPAQVAPVPTTPSRPRSVAGKAAPIETDNPCRWSQSPDGTLICTGRRVMRPGPGDPLRVRNAVWYMTRSASVASTCASFPGRRKPILSWSARRATGR